MAKAYTAIAVVGFATVGMTGRFWLSYWTKALDFGIDTTQADPSSKYCVHTSGASGFFLQNALGTLLMAMVARHKNELHASFAAGLSSGLCGSLTTFGTWMHHSVIAALNGELWMSLIGVVSMLCVSICCYNLGWHAAACGYDAKTYAEAAKQNQCKRNSTDEEVSQSEDSCASESSHDTIDWSLASVRPVHQDPTARMQAFELPTAIVCGAAVLSTMVWMATVQNYVGLMDIAFAPLGALARWGLSLLNPSVEPFPWFTLLANLLGCTAAGLSPIFVSRSADDLVSAAWVAVGTGFGGCLSTVSTFISELVGDRLGGFRLRGIYCLTSFTLAWAILIAVDCLLPCNA